MFSYCFITDAIPGRSRTKSKAFGIVLRTSHSRIWGIKFVDSPTKERETSSQKCNRWFWL